MGPPPLQMDAMLTQQPPHVIVRHVAQGLGHQRPGPGRVAVRQRLGHHVEDALLGLLVILPRRTRPRRVLQPVQACAAKRVRHLLTVAWRTPSRPAMVTDAWPSAASKMMRARKASRCSVVPDRAHCGSVARSSSVNEHLGPTNIWVAGRGMPPKIRYDDNSYE